MSTSTHPEALPPPPSKAIRDTVLGTVIVDQTLPRWLPGHIDMELVDPQELSSRQESTATFSSTEVVEGTSPKSTISSSSSSSSFFSPHNVSFSSEEICLTGEKGMLYRPVYDPPTNPLVQEGGYILFTDSFVARYPTSPVATLTREYQQKGDTQARWEEPHTKPTCAHAVVEDAHNCKRPVFRRRSSDLVYGRSSYIK